MSFERILDKDHAPTELEIIDAIGSAELWEAIRDYLDRSYDFQPELVYYGNKYGWTIRYRRSGKTLCSLFPEHGAFTVLIVLGKKEGSRATEVLDRLSPTTKEVVGSAKQLHDGKWLWIRILEPAHVADVKLLLTAKRKPQIQEP